jgi:hypothetical protein
MPHRIWLATFTHRTHNDEVRSAFLRQSRYGRTDTAREGMGKSWVNKESPTPHDYLLIAQEVSHSDTKGSALNISFHVSGGRRSQYEHPFLSCGEGELANERSLIDIRDIRDTLTLTKRAGDSTHRA